MSAGSDRADPTGGRGKREGAHDLRRRAFLALGSTAVVVGIDRVLQVAFLVVLARVLTPEQTGVAAAAGAVAGLLSLAVSFGIPSALIQMAQVTVRTEAVARTTLLAPCALAVLVVEIFAPWAGRWFRSADVTEALRVMVLFVLAIPFAGPAFARLSKELRTRDTALADLAGNITGSLLVTIPAALVGYGYWALVFGFLAQTAMRTALQCLFARQKLALGVDWRASAALGRQGAGFMMNGLLGYASADAPRWVIGRFLPVAALGLYTRANSLMGLPAGLFAAVVDRVIFPAVALVQDQAERVRSGALDAVRLVAIIGLPMSIALILLGPDIIRLILGPQWVGAIEPFKILSIGIYFCLVDRLNWVILRGLGRPYQLAALQTVFLAFTIASCVVGARWGLSGVAAAVVTSFGVAYVLNSIVAMKAAGVELTAWLYAHGRGIACGVLAASVIGPLSFVLHGAHAEPGVVLVLCAAASALIGGLAIWFGSGVFLGPEGERLVALLKGRLANGAGPGAVH